MSISNETVEQLFVADGIDTEFPLPFDFIDGDESTITKVYLVEIATGEKTLQVEGALQDYTFVDNGVDPPAAIEFNTAPPATHRVFIERSLSLQQVTEYISGSFPFGPHEKQMDKIVMMIQQLAVRVARSLQLNILTTPFDPTLPLLAANKTLIVGPDGTSFALGPTPDELASALTSVADAEAARDAALAAQAAAELAETNAETAETNAETAETNAETAETNAETAQAAAEAALAATLVAMEGFAMGGPHTVLNNDNSDLAGELFDSGVYTQVDFEARIVRGTTIFARQEFSIFFRDGAWELVLGFDRGVAAHGVTFTVHATTGQINAAADNGVGNATITFKKSRWAA